MYRPVIEHANVLELQPEQLNAFELLIQYLGNPDAERIFKAHAKAYALSLLQPNQILNQVSFESWNEIMKPILYNLGADDAPFVFGDTIFAQWYPRRTQGLKVVAGVSKAEMQRDRHTTVPIVYSVFDDGLDRDRAFEASWNAFWSFANMMQFLPVFAAVTTQEFILQFTDRCQQCQGLIANYLTVLVSLVSHGRIPTTNCLMT